MITTQSEYIISPPNKDKVPITNMQLALKTISGVQSNTNYEGDKVDLVDGDGGDDGADEDVDGDASSQAKEEWGCRRHRFPLHRRHRCNRICPIPE